MNCISSLAVKEYSESTHHGPNGYEDSNQSIVGTGLITKVTHDG